MVSKPQNIIRRKQVEIRTGLSRATIYRRISVGEFPAPISLGGDSVGWIESEVDTWIEERIQQSRKTTSARKAAANDAAVTA